MRTIVWYREHDLRTADHEPLRDATRDRQVIPLFVLDPQTFSPDRAIAMPHRVQFLLDALADLDAGLRRAGSQLLLWSGPPEAVVPTLAERLAVDRVVTHQLTDPPDRAVEHGVKRALGRRLQCFRGHTLHELGTLQNGSGQPYSVYTAFARAFRARVEVGSVLAAPRALPPLPAEALRVLGELPAALPTLTELGILRNARVAPGGERAAQRRLRKFAANNAARYAALRNRTDIDGTSRLSADLSFGTVSVRRVWHEVAEACGATAALDRFRDQLIWREFTHSTLWHRPELLHHPFKAEFADFPWRTDDTALTAWKRGLTGYPMVDAAARQLLEEGFVHNRARMVAASFLCKHLLLDYRSGEKHYLSWLTDADVAQNNAGWQWCAGSGCSAQPFFRILNPVLQGKKFDPQGHYVRRWVPELSRLPERFIHEPWNAPGEELHAAGVALGSSYPHPIVDHQEARARALTTARRHFRDGYVPEVTSV
jgi:deoxyribodipyrimidine photo-lyase